MSFESPKKPFRLEPAGVSAGGFPKYERWEDEDSETIIERTRKKLGEIARKIRDDDLNEEQRKSVSEIGVAAMAAAAAVMSPNNSHEDDSVRGAPTEQVDSGGDNNNNNKVRIPVPVPPMKFERSEGTTITPEQFEQSPNFYNEVSGYLARTKLRFDEAIFVDQNNRPIGQPVKLESFTVTKDGKPYLVTPGPVDEHGILTDGIAGEWLEYKRAELKEQYENASEFRVMSVAGHFEAALQTNDEPELVAGIKEGRIVTYIDLVNYYANKEVIGGGGLTRKEYVQEKITFSDDVPAAAQEVFREFALGLLIQESGGNNGLESRTGAKGAGQFQPTTWKELGMEEEDILSFIKQIDAMGRYFSTLYKQVQFHILNQRKNGSYESSPDGERTISALKQQLGEEQFQVFVALCALNGYNTGASRIAEGVVQYVKSKNYKLDISDGRELFTAMSHYAYVSGTGKLNAYGSDGVEYVFRAKANAVAFGGDEPRMKVSVGFNF